MTNQIQQVATPGSLADVANKTGTSIAEAFIGADYVILVDTSGSMAQEDGARGKITNWEERTYQPGRTRYDVACDELAKLQKSLPGKIAVMSFSSSTMFCPTGVPTFLMGGTDLAEALKFVHIADGLVEKFIVISDGHPDDERDALKQAGRFTTIIDTVYVGPEGGPGADFLRQLAAASGGQSVRSNKASDLAGSVQQLLLAS